MASDPGSPASGSLPEFSIKDCALIAIATGQRAVTLPEFRNIVTQIGESSLYHHFWGGLLVTRFEEREYNNDFAAWARHGLHDSALAERLAAVDPTDHDDLESLRQMLLELVEMRLDEADHLNWTRATSQFEFIRSQIVVFDTHKRLTHPRQMAELIPSLSSSSIFYHFIDARRRTSDGSDDFSPWLLLFDENYDELVARLKGIDPFFGNLSELRQELAGVVQAFFEEAGHESAG